MRSHECECESCCSVATWGRCGRQPTDWSAAAHDRANTMGRLAHSDRSSSFTATMAISGAVSGAARVFD